MIGRRARVLDVSRLIWIVLFALTALYVASRMGLFALFAEAPTAEGITRLPNTFASVDHPFHVARAETLWRELASGHFLRWIGQHQGGYPVEFYPLGEAWLEVAVRASSLGTLPVEGAHTIAVILIFLLPGLAFAALACIDRVSPAIAILALSLHVSLPGSWYDGGYTELVQWGLVTNVAGAVAALLMFPALIRYLNQGDAMAAAVASLLAAAAIYCNPRSMVGLIALGIGSWGVAVWGRRFAIAMTISIRLGTVAIVAALITAPELLALARFGDLYTFVRYSGYDTVARYLSASVGALSPPIFVLAVAGIIATMLTRRHMATLSAAASLVLYAAMTLALTFVPIWTSLASQLEPTRLMPLQRLLMIYLAASAVWAALVWLSANFVPPRGWIAPAIAATAAIAVLVVQTRPLVGPALDPASPAIPATSLYPVAMSARPEQAELEAAVRAVDEEAEAGTAILVLGSALSWHQPLWAPLWTTRPLYYDNWLWYWHPDQFGTPGYRPEAGHHFPDSEQTLVPAFLDAHGIGAVVATGRAQDMASIAPNLRLVRSGAYDAFLVRNPMTTISFNDRNAEAQKIGNQSVSARSAAPGSPVDARINWHPRWAASVNSHATGITRRDDGFIQISGVSQASAVELDYQVQGLDWLARVFAVVGLGCVARMAITHRHGADVSRRWYSRHRLGHARGRPDADAEARRTHENHEPLGGG